MRLTHSETERVERDELVCHGCFSHDVVRRCALCDHYFCWDCFGGEDWRFWCEAKMEDEHAD